MVVVIICATAIVMGCLFSESFRILVVKVLIGILQFFVAIFSNFLKGLGLGVGKTWKLSVIIGSLLGGVALASVPIIDYMVSDLPSQDKLYVDQYWSIFQRVGEEKDVNPLFLLSIVKIEGGVRDGSLVNPGNGQGIGQLYSWVKVAKLYYFPPGPIDDNEAERQIGLIADFVNGKCSDLQINYADMGNASEEVLWDRVACFERYNGVRGGVRGQMDTYPAVFNNLPGYPNLKGMLIPDGDLSSNLVPMAQDGYEVIYRKFSSYLAVKNSGEMVGNSRINLNLGGLLNGVMSLIENNVVGVGGDLSMITDFTPIASIPYSLNDHDCSNYVDPGMLGPKIPPIKEDFRMSVNGGCHEALAVDLTTDSYVATLISPIAGEVTAVYNDGFRGDYGTGNSVIVIENQEWLVAFLHAKDISVKVGDKLNAGDYVAMMGAVGNASGPHLHYNVFFKPSNTFVYAGFYVFGH